MGLTKAEIITRISEKNGVSKNDATNIVEATFDIIKASLERGEKVRIQNFGKFSVRTKNQRRGRNPQTGGYPRAQGRNFCGQPDDEGKRQGCALGFMPP